MRTWFLSVRMRVKRERFVVEREDREIFAVPQIAPLVVVLAEC